MIENRQKSTTFWDRVHNHFNESHLLVVLQDMQGVWKQNGALFNMMLPSL
jgi:hypothetical protein